MTTVFSVFVQKQQDYFPRARRIRRDLNPREFAVAAVAVGKRRARDRRSEVVHAAEFTAVVARGNESRRGGVREREEEESERKKHRRRQFARERVEKKIVSKPAALRNKLVERVITGTQPVRRRSPRNLERKAYNFSRNAANSRPREVGVKETAASIREKRQMDSRMRIEAVAKNAELRAKRVNLMHRRATTTTVQEEEEEEKDMDDYGPSVTQAVGGFERKRRQVDETRWTLAENKKYITGTQPRKPSREYIEGKNRATATVKRNVKRVTSTRKYYGFGSTYTSPPKKATNQKRRREDDERFYEEEEEEEFQQHWPPRTTAAISPHLQTASRAKGRAAMEAAKKEAAERRKMNDTMKIFNRPIAACENTRLLPLPLSPPLLIRRMIRAWSKQIRTMMYLSSLRSLLSLAADASLT